MSAPSRDSACRNAPDAAPALGPSLEVRVAQKAASILGNSERPNIEVDKTEMAAAQRFIVVIAVPRDKSRPSHRSEEWDDLVVQHTFATDVMADLTKGNVPAAQLEALVLDDVFIQDDHAGIGLSSNLPAARMASAIAGREMLPWHCLMMSSQSIPSATNSRTQLTRSRVPRNVSFPWQIFGSATMYRPMRLVFM